MLEAGVALAIATVTGVAAITNKLNLRMSEIDRRVDQMELRIAENYVSKADMEILIDRVEAHLIRLENKLDKLTFR